MASVSACASIMHITDSEHPASKSSYSGYHFVREILLPTLRGKRNDDLDTDSDSDNSSERVLDSWCYVRLLIVHLSA